MTNRLAQADSAYLRQHAENPVDWYEWGDEAFAAARELDRPIFLSVGYAACHWCHVMAHESFDDDVTAALLNQEFVAIKVDREERPDVDAIYMAATQLVAGHGGWPMSVFLTPDGRAFMAGTYYPPVDRQGQPGFPRLLLAMADAWRHQRDSVLEQANEIATATAREVRFVDRLSALTPTTSPREVDDALVAHLVERVDADGGFGDAPKFPRPSYVEALLRRWSDDNARDAATRTLDAMSRRGLYDHLRGGFARYSVDGIWHVPHFEKMLSDQALLAACYLRADRVAGGGTPWRDVALDTMRFVVRDLRVDGGLASSLDADADGVEGSHVTWTRHEVDSALADAGVSSLAPATYARWRIDENGTFEGRSIPRLGDGESFVTPDSLIPALEALRAARDRRVQPGRDEKVVLEWNAMFASATFESADPELEAFGRELLDSLRDTHFDGERWWRTSARRAHASAADLGWIIDAHVSAFELDGEDRWLQPVPEMIEYLLTHYWDGELPTADSPDVGGGVFTIPDLVTDLRERPKEIFDGATASSHAVVATALARYALVRADEDAAAVAARLVALAGSLVEGHPGAVPDLVRAFGYVADGREIVVPGERGPLCDLVRSCFVPASVVITGSGSSPLLEDRQVGVAYVCRHRVCSLPVRTTGELRTQLGELDAAAR